MYTTCPKCSYERRETDTADPGTCPACGIIFSKWMKQKFSSSDSNTRHTDNTDPEKCSSIFDLFVNSVLYIEPNINPFYYYGRVIAFVLMVYIGWNFITLDFHENPFPLANSFMHRIHLVFHEAGHVIFMPFGFFMTILGGTLGQLIMPTVVLGHFLYKQNTFAATVGLWWLAHSFMDIAPYIDDALVQQLVLLGGHTGADAPGNHDWNNILVELDRLEKCNGYANLAYNFGTFLMFIAFAWGAYILFYQYKHIDKRF
ncbi:MAG: hypothetical protein DRQ58_08355 [Gammaproteobacteria bacterium]|nr:MAG: hypothetical protein DRQ58_08355 [Gammaproteobacteria bacterium]